MTTKTWITDGAEMFKVEKARKQPTGHKQFTRLTPTGKLAQVPAKGFVKPKEFPSGHLDNLTDALRKDEELLAAVEDAMGGTPVEHLMEGLSAEKRKDLDYILSTFTEDELGQARGALAQGGEEDTLEADAQRYFNEGMPRHEVKRRLLMLYSRAWKNQIDVVVRNLRKT